jgi:hypothetical protein
MSKKKSKFDYLQKEDLSDESGLIIDETETVSDGRATASEVPLKPTVKPVQKKKSSLKSLTKDGKSKKFILPIKTKKQNPNLKEMAINFSKGLKRGLNQLRITK